MGFNYTLPQRLMQDKDVSDSAKLMFALISALSNNDYEACFSSNKYFCEYFDCKVDKILTMLKELKQKEYILIKYKNETNKKGRKIYTIFDNSCQDDDEFCYGKNRNKQDFVTENSVTVLRKKTEPYPIIYNNKEYINIYSEKIQKERITMR
ncbi:helix-turn-helix domain-containing protein [Campylobacter hyointestinalis]|uniref:C4-dicarboxylate transporter family protein, DctQ subunit n=1 Tax=Campylobacter hyointestinalis subsp. hyointestinalis TaxID=91352 RepID=A0A9W5AQ71_CAMHY|nr:helix-turn-helix domain-containing protein [Campylobacter hyointestinalis]CUU73936.1 C4-dicarboxylate transporter family protein%2C DctQ subunit [Campylobacter hyointestinalis subsp. hyointestinalis]CUU81779.1 C4-dicarboxylate transporter family protein%2C DctQ subunit [Campylobacter hyointestinalis subsp. hyointestinalis]